MRFRRFASNRSPHPTNTTFPTTVSTFSNLPTTTIPTISTTTTTPTTSVTNTITTNFTTTTFARFCFGNATFITTSTKKEKRKKIGPTHHHPRKGPIDKKTKKKMSASQDPIVGDSQPYKSFWEKVRAIFYELMKSETRNAYQITSNWRDIRLKCTEFGGIYNNLLNIRKSGSNDFDVFKVAMDQFEKTTPTRKAFPYMKSWLKLKDAPKWKDQTEETSESSGSKRSKKPDGTSQQSDDRTHIDINDDQLDLENEQPLRWPVERNKAKKRLQHLRALVQKPKAEVMTRMEQRIIEAQASFQETQDDPNKNRYENLENECGLPRRRRLGAFSRDERVVI
uniref:No apical meristem-associated C-terminal domain-containing protein n=1 Tax=Lactuca sativa TaxID=4236 RepID=A0A9R1X1Q5_LACSA|nr:hypothetical protein LSAT_V11C700372060 [Lactuca sativa]